MNHPNIVKYEGIFGSHGNIYIVMEYFPLGSLNVFVEKEASKLKSVDLISFSKQTAAGMTYLESMRIIHRDLSLRNLLIGQTSDGYVIKISDFGLSRSVEAAYYVTKDGEIPIKWCAPEVLKYGTCSSKSDIYSFGVLLWELFSYGKCPYEGYSNQQARIRILNGNTLPVPTACPPDVCILMQNCWAMNTEQRPNFQQTYTELCKIYNNIREQESPSIPLFEPKETIKENDYGGIIVFEEPSKNTSKESFYGGFVSVQSEYNA